MSRRCWQIPSGSAPPYDPKEGYELAGFVWLQGFNDLVDGTTYPGPNEPGKYDLYSDLLAKFIRDVRKDLSAPKMPFVIGVLGVGGESDNEVFRKAMAAPADMPEFKGNVVAVETAPFWDHAIAAAEPKQGEYNNIVGTAGSGVAARVVVHQGESESSRHDDRAQNFAGLGGTFVDRPEAHAVPGIGAEAGVHHHDHHALLVGFVVGLGGDDLQPEPVEVFGRVGVERAGVLAHAGDGDAAGGAWAVLCRVPNYAAKRVVSLHYRGIFLLQNDIIRSIFPL